MTEHVFRAADSDSAMEKAIRELGDDAMILSVKRVGDVTEIRAMKDTAAPRRIRKQTTVVNGTGAQQIDLATAMRQARARRAEPAEPAPINIFLDEGEDGPAPIKDNPPPAPKPKPTPVAPPKSAPEPAPAAPPEPAPKLEVRISSPVIPIPRIVKPSLTTSSSQAVETATPVGKKSLVLKPFDPNANTEQHSKDPKPLTATTPVLRPYVPQSQTQVPSAQPTISSPARAEPHILAQSGFPADIVAASTTALYTGNVAAQLNRASELLAERLTAEPDAPAQLDSEIVFVFGPPGSGKTTTAAKIAFNRIQSSQSRPSMLSLSKSGLFSDDKLRRHAGFLNTPYVDTLAASNLPLVIDCDHTDPTQIRAAMATVQDRFPDTRMQPVLTIPGTWSASAISKIVRDMAQPSLSAIITHMQISGISIEGLSALGAANVNVISTMGSALISDGVPMATATSLAAHIRETFNNRESDS